MVEQWVEWEISSFYVEFAVYFSCSHSMLGCWMLVSWTDQTTNSKLLKESMRRCHELWKIVLSGFRALHDTEGDKSKCVKNKIERETLFKFSAWLPWILHHSRLMWGWDRVPERRVVIMIESWERKSIHFIVFFLRFTILSKSHFHIPLLSCSTVYYY